MDPVTFQGLSPGGTEGVFGYNIPNLLIDHAMRNPSVPAGFWRGVNTNHNAIYVETFIDELAHSVGDDPLAFRLKYLKPKHAAVLKAVAEKAGYSTPAPQGIHRGLAQIMGFGSYVAACAEVAVDGGQVKIYALSAGPIAAMQSIPNKSTARLRAPSSTASRPCSSANARYVAVASSSETSILVSGHAHRPDTKGRDRGHAGW